MFCLFKILKSLKRILWILQRTYHFLNFSPLLIHVLHFALIFLSEAETYFCIFEMLEISRETFKKLIQEKNSDKFKYLSYFHLAREDFEKLI
jgi:hypothetical protein